MREFTFEVEMQSSVLPSPDKEEACVVTGWQDRTAEQGTTQKKGFWLACRRSQVFSQAARRCTANAPAGCWRRMLLDFVYSCLAADLPYQEFAAC